MNTESHFKCLISMYGAAAINAIDQPVLSLRKAEATIRIQLDTKYHHACRWQSGE